MNILAVFAHPDDETMLCGGILALLARAGQRVHYVCATRGEGGETGEPPVCAPGQLGEVREQELVCAVRALGGSSLTFLGYVDPAVGPGEALYPFRAELALLAGQVAASIRQFEAQAVITHGSNGEYGHPAHVLVHQAARVAVESLQKQGQSVLLYTPMAAYPSHPRPRLANKDDPAHLVLDVAAAREQKVQAALCHRTQHALFVRRLSQDAGRALSVPETILLEESLHRAYPPASMARPTDALAQLLVSYRKAARRMGHGRPSNQDDQR